MANEIKTRDPQADLYHNDYLTWINNTVVWLGTQVAEADYPAHLAPNLAPLVPAFAGALDAWHTLNELANGRNEIFTTAFDNLRSQLQLIKESLPTVAAVGNALRTARAAGFSIAPPMKFVGSATTLTASSVSVVGSGSWNIPCRRS